MVCLSRSGQVLSSPCGLATRKRFGARRPNHRERRPDHHPTDDRPCLRSSSPGSEAGRAEERGVRDPADTPGNPSSDLSSNEKILAFLLLRASEPGSDGSRRRWLSVSTPRAERKTGSQAAQLPRRLLEPDRYPREKRARHKKPASAQAITTVRAREHHPQREPKTNLLFPFGGPADTRAPREPKGAAGSLEEFDQYRISGSRR